MAPIGERNDTMGSVAADEDDSDSQNLWATILGEVQSSSASQLPSTKSVLVLGDNECGKTTLIAKLQGVEEPKKGSGLEYYYIDVQDEYRDDQARLGVWVLDGDLSHTGLLKFCITEENFAHSLVLLVTSMTQPWSIMETLQRWSRILNEHLDKLKISPEDRREYDESLVRFFQEYTEPEEGQPTSSQSTHRRDVNALHPTASHTDEDKVLLPLGENTLSHNLGIPLVVVITKTDAISTLEKEHDYREEHFDFIQQHVRKFCLRYGAALFYTSVKEDKNCDLLHRYLTHRIYGFPFNSPAYVVEKDSVFVPTGWDNEKKISILYENLSSMKPDDIYEDVIAKPIMRKPVQRDAEVIADDEQVFLVKQQAQLSKAPAPGAAGESPVRPQGTSPKPSKTTSTPMVATSSPKKLDAKNPGAQASEGMLANFFNSLLNKNPRAPTNSTSRAGAPSLYLHRQKIQATTRDHTNVGNTPNLLLNRPKVPGTREPKSTKFNERWPRDKAAVTRDATAELERLRTKKPVGDAKPNGPDPAAS